MPKRATSIVQVCLLLILTVAVCRSVSADNSKPSEYQVKTAMLFNMIKFVDWPQESLSTQKSSISICVLGKGAFSTALDALHGEQLKGRKVTVQHISQAAEAANCQVLVIGDIDRRAVTSVIERTRQHIVLTVSDMPNFAQAGGVVGFVEQDGKIRFVINTTAAQQHRVRISAQLLKIARIVQDQL